MLIDTHAHLFDERFGAEAPAVLDRASSAGVGRVICIGIDRGSSQASISWAASRDGLWASVGIHPNHAAQACPEDWDCIIAWAEHPRACAIGETGLDRHWDFTPFSLQEDYFSRHLELSRRVNKPVVIHCREAEAEVLKLLREAYDRHGPVRGVMHAFSGDQALAEACLAMGLYISFAGMITYKNAARLRQVAAGIPGDRLLLETDAPYLAPVPHRGQRNEPAYLVHTAQVLAQVRGLSRDHLADLTTRNACTLFGWV